MRRIRNPNDKQLVGLLVAISIMSKRLAQELANKRREGQLWTNMQVYKHEQFGEIRTLTKNGEIWFVAADVCNVLDLTNPTMAVARLDEGRTV